MAWSESRRALLPAPTLPLVYFAGAHVALAAAAAALAFNPDLPGGFHYHPRLIAVVHLVTLGWISASILGAFYIVAPLAFGMPFAARRLDGFACGLFWLGTAGMVTGFWLADYALVGGASIAALAAMLVVAVRAWRGLLAVRLPRGVSLHVALAFLNVIVAGGAGGVLAVARSQGLLHASPLALAAAHAHAAVLGWAVMMIIGVSYRLVPMFLPAAMPAGRSLAATAVLLEVGTLGLAWTLVAGGRPLPWALVITAAFGVFAWQVRRILKSRRTRPAEMTGRDWSVWQTHAAMLCLVPSAVTGVSLAAGAAAPAWSWIYGVTGIAGFAAQMVIGIEGRLLPMHAWYRAMAQRDGAPPARSAHRLADGRLTCAIFLLWLVAIPGLAAGLALKAHALIGVSALLLLAATIVQAAHMGLILRRAARGA